jgi:hypothetical protein
MEIVLLLIIIVLLIIFNANRSSKLSQLEKKLSNVENYLKHIQFSQSKPEVKKPEPVKETPKAETPPVVPPTTVPPVVPPVVETPPIPQSIKIPPPIKEPEVKRVQEVRNVPPPPPKPSVPQKSWYDKFRENNPDLEKFIGENILSKVAIAVLVLGIAFFVKYAIDKNWINEAARTGIGILSGGIVLGFAHRLHKRFKAFSSVLVAGGISIFYFTIGIAFHEYKLFDQTTAFIIMLLITAFSVFISVIYDRVELAALSIIGGFATPFILSTGEGNYKILFTYILILDTGMLVLAYLRKWNLINILAYAFTMLLYVVWLESKVMGDPYGPYRGALFFGGIFYVVFVLMNIINNIKEKRKFEAIEISILISNTFIFYGTGMQLLNYYQPEFKGLFSICMAFFNLVCSWLLYKKYKADAKLVYLMIGLTLTFITIAAPVQLKGNYITLFWALESVLLIWLSQKSGIVLYRFASVAVSFLMVLSLFMDWGSVYRMYRVDDITHMIFINKGFTTGIVSAFSLFAISMLLKKEVKENPEAVINYMTLPFHAKNYSIALKVLFTIFLYLTGMLELTYQMSERLDGDVAYFIIVMCYHLGYVAALNFVLGKYPDSAAEKVVLVLNYASVAVFLIGFAFQPLNDLRENMIQTYRNYYGLIFHYISLGLAIFLSWRIYKNVGTGNKNVHILNSILISVAIVYVGSIELLLHIAQFTISTVPTPDNGLIISKFDEYSTVRRHVVKIGYPVLWGLLAFAFLFFGMKNKNKTLRIAALALIGITLLKLFLFDIKHASEAGKIVAFILLGVVLLIISFMYQKIKALLIDDQKLEPRPEEIKP